MILGRNKPAKNAASESGADKPAAALSTVPAAEGGAQPREAAGGELPSVPNSEVLDAAAAGGGEPAGERAGTRLQRAQQLSAAGRFREAAELFESCLAEDPDDLDPLLGLGSALLALGQFEPAERELRRALKAAPERAEVHRQLGLTLSKRGVYAAAAAELRRSIELDPADASAHLILGEALNQLGEADAAVAALEESLRLDAANGRAFYALGIAFDRKGDPARAAEMYRRSRELSQK